MPKRRQSIEIVAPTEGLKYDAPASMIPLRAQPEGSNGKMYYGVNQKEFGTSLFATGTVSSLTVPINMIFDAKYPGGSVLEVITHTGAHKYTSGTDSYVSDGQTFTGTFTNFFNGVMYNEQFFYTNGIDPIQVKTSVSATGTNMTSALNPTTYKAWAISGFREHLNLYHTIENGTEFSKRVRWAKKGTLVLSAGTTDFASGTAGALDIPDCEGEIKTAVSLGVTEAVYAERSIHIQTWVGGDEIYRFTKTLSGIGTPSRRGVVSFGNVNYFIGHNNFYAYYGGDDLREVGDPIKSKAFFEINNSQIATAFVEVDPQYNEVWFHVPINTDTMPSIVWVYRLENESWSRLQRSQTAKGSTTRKTGLTIGELQGTIGDQNFTFGSFFLAEESEVQVYGDASGRVVKKDPSRYTISSSGTSTSQSFVYATPDIVGLLPSKLSDPVDRDPIDYTTVFKRYTQFEFEATGNGTATVFYSTDRGGTYTAFPQSPVTLLNTTTTYTLDLDVSSRQCRFKIECTGTNDFIGISYLKPEIIVGATV
mgnify:CR=1 FL=1